MYRFLRQLFFVARNCFRDESERLPPTFPEILHRARSHNHPCRFFSKLMFRRHELREFGRKQRVTDPVSVIIPFRWPCSLNHADDQWCWMTLKRLKHHVDRINSKIKEILKNIVINTIKMNQYSMKNYRDFKML